MSDSEISESSRLSDKYRETYYNKLRDEDSYFEEDVGEYPDYDEIQTYKRVKRFAENFRYRVESMNDDYANAHRFFKKHNLPRLIVKRGRVYIHWELKNKESFNKKKTWNYHISVHMDDEWAYLVGEKVKGSNKLNNVFLIEESGYNFYKENKGKKDDRYDMDKTKARQIKTWKDVDKDKIWGKCLKAVLSDWNECKKVFKYT
jgi:hypothetical protein